MQDRRRSTRRAPSLSAAAKTSGQIAALSPFSWIRSDSFTSSGGKVTAWVDLANPSHQLSQGNSARQVNVPSPSGLFAGRAAATFTPAGTTRYISSLPASSWRFLHDGTGCDLIIVYSPTSEGGLLLGTKDGSAGQAGVFLQSTGGSLRLAVANGTSTIINANQATPATTLGAATYGGYSYSEAASPKYARYVKSDGSNSGSPSGAPAAGDPGGTLVLGGSGAENFLADMLFAELLVFNRVLTAPERQTMAAYMAARYGL